MEENFLRKGLKQLGKNKHLIFLLLLPVTNIVFTPLQSRLISPSLLGSYTSYILIVSMLRIFATFKSETIMYYSTNEEEYKKVGATSIYILKYTTVVFTLLLSLFWYFYSKGDWKQVLIVTIITPFIIYTQGIDDVSRLYNIRLSNSKYYYKLSFYRNFFKNTSIIFLAWAFSPSLIWILVGEVSGRLMAVWSQLKEISGERIKDVYSWIVKNRKNTIYYSVSLLVNSITSSIPLLFIQYNNGQFGGEYAMYYRICSIPAMLIATVFADKLSALDNSDYKSQRQILWALGGIGLCAFLFLQLVPASFYTFFLGSQWINIHRIIKILSLSLVMDMIYSSISIAFILKNIISYKYWSDGIVLIVTLIPFIIQQIDFFDQIYLLNVLRSSVSALFIIILLIKIRK